MSGPNLAARLITGPIRLYQRIISPALPANCRYYPTCSQYAVEAISEHGAVRGTALALRRVGRCQPWSKRPHFDPVPLRDPVDAPPNGRFESVREPAADVNSSSTGPQRRPTQLGRQGSAVFSERSTTA